MENNEWQGISKFNNSNDSPGFLLWKMHLIWRRMVEKSLVKYDLTHPQFVVLASITYLTQNKTSLTQIELSNHVSLDANTVSQILRILEKKFMITRIIKDGNVKSKYPKLTELGYTTFKQAIHAVEEVDQNFFKQLNDLKLKSFVTHMHSLIEGNEL